ncbi:MAG: pyruvate kinase [Acidobacteriaceae bacterium]
MSSTSTLTSSPTAIDIPLSVTAAAQRRAKIVCTIGPASNSEAILRDLMRAGMNVARLNFSHGTQEDKAKLIQRIRAVAAEERHTICIMGDLQGPKIRTGRLKYRTAVAIKTGSKVTITPRDVPGTATLISTTFQTLAVELTVGARILLSDGLIELRVRAIKGDDVECDVINGGMLGEHKGINLPDILLSVPSLTEKDENDLQFALSHGVDMIAASFIRTANDVRVIRSKITGMGSDAWLIAKLEKPQAIDHLEEILEAADGVMVARGDLGVEVPPERVPILQKHIIRRAADWRKPCITATQMLESMIENPRPTRAEASDVANAIFDGTDAVMLSGETASGKYPREAVTMMAKIVVETEEEMRQTPGSFLLRRRDHTKLSISETICESIAHAAQDLDMRAIAVFTETGNSARLISKYRPSALVYAFGPGPVICNRMNLLWGVHPILSDGHWHTEEMVQHAEKELLRSNIVFEGDVLGVVAGTRTHFSGTTNLMRLHVVGADEDGERGIKAFRVYRDRHPTRGVSRPGTGQVPERRRTR